MAEDEGGPGGDITSSSEMSFEISGVGMGRPVERSPRPNFQLKDFFPNERSSPKTIREKKFNQAIKISENPAVEPVTGPIWSSCIRDPQSGGVIVGSMNNKYPFFGRVTRFESLEDTTNLIARDLKSSGCNKLCSLNTETFAAAFLTGNVVLWDYNLTVTGDSLMKLSRHYGTVTGIKAGYDGNSLLTCGRDRKVCLTDAKSGILRDEIREAHLDGCHDLAPASDSDNCVLTCGLDKVVSLWDWRIKDGGRSREVACADISRTPTAIHWSNVEPNLFYVGMSEGSFACFDVRNLDCEDVARQVSPGCKITAIKPLDHSKLAIISEGHTFEIIEEKTLIPTFTSTPIGGIIEDIIQKEESIIYSVGRNGGFTKHYVIHNSQTQTDLESDEEET